VAEGLLLVGAALLLAWKARPRTEARLFCAGAAILALPVLMLLVNTQLELGPQDFWESDFFVPAGVFALTGLAFAMRGPAGAVSGPRPAPT
jgi:hypothetical protein